MRNSGEIGSFVVVGERGVASGVRRIEALAGRPADEYLKGQRRLLASVEEELGVPEEQLVGEIGDRHHRADASAHGPRVGRFGEEESFGEAGATPEEEAKLAQRREQVDCALRIVRLVAAAWSLYLRHRVDAKGRCRHCPRRRGWLGWWGGWRFDRRRTGQCTVLATLSFYLMQPTEVVLRELPRRVSVKP